MDNICAKTLSKNKNVQYDIDLLYDFPYKVMHFKLTITHSTFSITQLVLYM